MIAPARLAAIDALVKIDAGSLDLGEAMARARATLKDDRDRALLLEIVTGTLRMQAAIDYQLALRVSRPLAKLDSAVLRILRVSGFQLLYLTRQPASAVINDAVHLTKRAGPGQRGAAEARRRPRGIDLARARGRPRVSLDGPLTSGLARRTLDRSLRPRRYGSLGGLQ
jgi:transcription termination factor NusB